MITSREESSCHFMSTFKPLTSEMYTSNYFKLLHTISTTCAPSQNVLWFSFSPQRKADATTNNSLIYTDAVTINLTKLYPLIIHLRFNNVI